MSSQPTLDHDHVEALNALRAGEWKYRNGLIPDRELEARRDAYRPYSPRSGERWAQPTVAELRAAGDHAEAGRIRALQHDLATRHAQDAFDRLNPEFGVPADHTSPTGQRAVQDREAGLALGTRAAVAITRENQPAPVVRVAGQDDRVAAAVRVARARQGPERTAAER